MRIYSPLRYPGGKGFLYNFIAKIIDSNFLNSYTYVEPYAGGAGLALALLTNKKIKKIILNDIDPAIYALWFSILNYTEELCKMIEETPVNIESYKEIKKKFKKTINILELGFATLFLNRTNRSGILNAGPIGGNLQTGKYKLDCRFNKERIISIIRDISAMKDRIEIYNLDAVDFLDKVIEKKETNFVFLDPPYYQKGSELYTNFYQKDDHAYLADFVLTNMANIPWIMTYDLANEILEFYSKKIPYVFLDVIYTAGTVKRKQEIMFYNNIIVPPQIEGTRNIVL
ncbi:MULTISPECIES: DNA adenine methylase [Thermoanaerobacterium]|uniref:site-specific DNA-methyltransferase (adenine-specific) n=2 Tax=Thermoanaerobacterium TaxID=28895 RepID=W9E9P5_9THEO|nr:MULTISPECIES: DNA adenine methylase [Thermoanaerobacterium]AFK85870.1 D12 class N6 adenine-specific DNA methyltransferase [Thermoanaerobacterium saccharolyticum JW/SL-YS485]ETO38642.1 D12 class N6 adenine-specific DNA methyltransferase [Thermoanaerobacterium aotearoense SCUT27]